VHYFREAYARFRALPTVEFATICTTGRRVAGGRLVRCCLAGCLVGAWVIRGVENWGSGRYDFAVSLFYHVFRVYPFMMGFPTF